MKVSNKVTLAGGRARLGVAALLVLAACGDAGGVEPWDGTLKSGVLAMAEQSAGGDVDGALGIADRMLAPGGAARLREKLNRATLGVSESVLSPVTKVLDLVGLSALSPEDRAEIEYARAAALLTGASKGEEDAPGLLERAQSALERARGAAPGEARMGAVYNLGTLDLLAAEAVRATIPEIAGGDAAGSQGPAAPPDPSQKDDAQEDPLPIARALYLNAREDFVEFLSQEFDENAAANVEFVIRRLRELDEIEKQREEQENQQQDQNQDKKDSEDGDKNQNQEPQNDEKQQENSDESKDSDSENQESKEDEPSETESDSESEEEQEPEKQPEEQDSEDGSEEESAEESQEDPEDQQPPPGEEQIEEKTMTAEEFQRLLERNSEHQERGEEIRRIRRMRGKIPAKKDW